MRIQLFFMLIGILISLTAAATSPEKDQKTKDSVKTKTTTTAADAVKALPSAISPKVDRSSKGSKSAQPGDNRGKRTLQEFTNTALLYPQIASRRAGYSQDGYYNGQNTVAQFPTQFNYNYSPYPQYIEAPEPIIEIIIKDSNETLGSANPQPLVRKTKKKKEKVHVFYVNYKKDENNKLHLESPIASLNNDDAEEEEEEEEEVIDYPVTPLPTVQATTLRTIIHPDSEKYQGNSGIHVTFGSEDKSQKGHILEEHNAESVQSHVVAVPIPQSGFKNHYSVESRQDIQSDARTPFANNNYYQSSSNLQYQSGQQLPAQHSTTYFRPPVQNQQHIGLNSHDYYHKAPSAQKTSVNSAPAQSQYQHLQQQQQPARKPLAQVQQQIHQHLQQQSQYYLNHNQVYQQQQQQQPQQQQQYQPSFQYYNGSPQKQSQSTKQQPILFPTSLPKSHDLPVRQVAPQSYQPIKFRPTAAAASSHLKPTPISTKLEKYHSKPYQFQRQPQFVQQPKFTVQSPTLPQYYKQQQQQHQAQQQQQPQQQQHQQSQQQQQHQSQQQQHPQQQQQLLFPAQSTNYQASSIYNTQNLGQQQQHTAGQYQVKQPTPSPITTGTSGVSWLNIMPSRETELLKSIPKFEQHITETIHNTNYQTGQYSTKNQVMHDIPAPNLAPQQQQQQQSFYSNTNGFGNQKQPQAQPQQQQQQYANYVTTSENLAASHHQLESSTQAPQFVQSTDGQKIMVVTPMPPNIYQQYQSGSNYPTSEGNQQQQSTHIVTSLRSEDTSKNYFHQQPRQGAATSIQSQQQSQLAPSSGSSQFSVSTHHSDVFKELGQRKAPEASETRNSYGSSNERTNEHSTLTSGTGIGTATATGSGIGSGTGSRSGSGSLSGLASVSGSASGSRVVSPSPAPANSKNLQQLPDEVPDDLRQQLLSSGILNNADISVLDYDKVGDIALENLPAEHLQHFYGAGGGAQISESKKVLTVVRPNGDKVSVDEKELHHVNHNRADKNKGDSKVVRLEGHPTISSEAGIAGSSGERQFNRYLPLKINAANFPKPNAEELISKTIQSVVVLAPVETLANTDGTIAEENKEVKFLGGDLIKILAKKPTKENFKRWLEKEARAAVDQQSVVLLVARHSPSSEQEIFMYDLSNGEVNKLNGDLSSKFVSVAEENASIEDLDHGSTLDPNILDAMIKQTVR